MPDDPSNLPAKTAPLDRTAIERVLARAAELQVSSTGADSSELLTESQLIQIQHQGRNFEADRRGYWGDLAPANVLVGYLRHLCGLD